MFSIENKHVHVGMEPSKPTKQDRNETIILIGVHSSRGLGGGGGGGGGGVGEDCWKKYHSE